jgi:hypothetical protein
MQSLHETRSGAGASVLATAEARREIGTIEDETSLSELILDLQARGIRVQHSLSDRQD